MKRDNDVKGIRYEEYRDMKGIRMAGEEMGYAGVKIQKGRQGEGSCLSGNNSEALTVGP